MTRSTVKVTATWILALVLVSMSSYSYADSGFKFKNYSTKDGWPAASINTILQDTIGFLWVGTAEGLVRFDGKHIRTYSTAQGLSDNYITASLLAANGDLLLGHFSGGVSRYQENGFKELVTNQAVGQIKQLAEDPGGVIWALGNSLAKFQGDTLQLVALPQLKGKILYQLVFVQDRLIVATNEGLVVFRKRSDENKYDYWQTLLPGFTITALEVNQAAQRIWIGTDFLGIYIWQSVQSDDPPQVKPLFSEVIPPNETIIELYEDDGHNLWIGTRLRGMFSVKFNEDLQILEQYNFNLESGFRSNLVTCFFEDNEGSMWIGTADQGLEQLIEKQVSFFDLKKSMDVDQVSTVVQLENGDFLIGTEKGLIRIRYDATTDFFGDRSFVAGPLSGIPISFIFDDGESRIWIGTEGRGIYVADRTLQGLRKSKFGNNIDVSNIHYITKDREGHIWISVSGFGVYKLDQQGEILQNYSTQTGFIHNEIYSIYPDSRGNIWLATHATGLAVISRNGTVSYPTKDGAFGGRDVNAIIQDNQGSIWIATDGNGLFRYDGRKYQNYLASHGLRSDYCKGLILDTSGNVWVAHSTGLSRVNGTLGTIETYGKNRGLQAESYLPNASTRDHHGNIWWGNPFGITRIQAPEDYLNTFGLSTNLTEVNLFRGEENLLNSLTDTKEKINLFYHQNHITFNFIAVSLKKQEGVSYQFRLLGYEEAWSPEIKENSATYTNLDPGEYVFEVRTSKSPGTYNHRTATVKLSIAEPFWQRGWFYVVQIVFLLGLIYLALNSHKANNRWFAQFTIYVCLFVLFEFIHTMVAPYMEGYTGGIPIFQVLLHLMLALALFPIERVVKHFLRKNQKVTIIKRYHYEDKSGNGSP